MAQPVSLTIGETRQLMPPGDANNVKEWITDKPAVVEVSDEDFSTGKHGGLIMALSPGTGRIGALGLDGERILEVDVTVTGAAPVILTVGETAELDTRAGSGAWVSTHPHVADVAAGGVVRGVSPGIAIVRREGAGGEAQIQVRVTGDLEIEVSQSLPLAQRFAVPVRSWNPRSTSASVDAQGIATAGDRPISVPIEVALAEGGEFTFSLRIVRPGGRPPPESPTVDSPTPNVVEPVPRRDEAETIEQETSTPAVIEDETWRARRNEVQERISQAEAFMAQDDWEAAGRALTAGNVSASGYQDLTEMIGRARNRLNLVLAQRAEATCAGVAAAIRRGDYSRARQMAGNARLPGEARAAPESLLELAGFLPTLNAEGCTEANAARLQSCLRQAWDAALGARMPGVALELARIAADWEVADMAERIVDVLGGTLLVNHPMSVRQELEVSLKQMGIPGIEAILARLINTAKGDAAGAWILAALVSMKPDKNAGLLVRYYASRNQRDRAQVVSWLSEMFNGSFETLIDIVAAVLRKLPLDRRLADAIQAQVGQQRFERECVKWAANGHKNARFVLERMCGFEP